MKQTLLCASFNVLADAYISYGNYSHVEPELLEPGAHIDYLVKLLSGLDADIIGLQEVERPLLNALHGAKYWQMLWSPKGNDKPDGCLALISPDINVTDFETT